MNIGKQYVANMTKFIDDMSPSSIAFLFFFRADTNQPNVVCTSKQLNYMNNVFYFVQANDPNYCYVYKERAIKYFVANFQNTNSVVAIYNSFNSNADSLLCHLEFSVHVSHKDGPIFKIHYSEYEATGEIGMERSATCIRNTNECNVKADLVSENASIDDFKKCTCNK